MTDRQTDGRTDARGKTICLPTLKGGDIKRAIKIILDYEYTDIASSMNELKILNIFEVIFLGKAKFMYKISKFITPSYINEEYKRCFMFI